jgi:hypothetical protein
VLIDKFGCKAINRCISSYEEIKDYRFIPFFIDQAELYKDEIECIGKDPRLLFAQQVLHNPELCKVQVDYPPIPWDEVDIYSKVFHLCLAPVKFSQYTKEEGLHKLRGITTVLREYNRSRTISKNIFGFILENITRLAIHLFGDDLDFTDLFADISDALESDDYGCFPELLILRNLPRFTWLEYTTESYNPICMGISEDYFHRLEQEDAQFLLDYYRRHFFISNYTFDMDFLVNMVLHFDLIAKVQSIRDEIDKRRKKSARKK